MQKRPIVAIDKLDIPVAFDQVLTPYDTQLLVRPGHMLVRFFHPDTNRQYGPDKTLSYITQS